MAELRRRGNPNTRLSISREADISDLRSSTSSITTASSILVPTASVHNATLFTYTLPVSNFSVPPYRNVSSAYNPCPSASATTYTDAYSQQYSVSCGVAYTAGDPADAEFGGNMGDLVTLPAYFLNDCTTMCTLWNENQTSIPHNELCWGVSWVPDISAVFPLFGANCILKNSTGPETPRESPYCVSAKLLA